MVATLPARKWKWRMRGAAVWFTRCETSWMSPPGGGAVDLILCNDMLSVADLRALVPPSMRSVPVVCYFHENQLTYPLPHEDDRDFQYGMTNITSCLAADKVWFNSGFHRDDFLDAAERLLRKMPDHVPPGLVADIREKSVVQSPPVLMERIDRPVTDAHGPPVILWCHRWEYDKNPEPFFDALLRLDAADRAFKLVLIGEQFRTAPGVFADSWHRLRRHVLHAGFLSDRGEYLSMLGQCDLVVSTAMQETFGIAVIEAMLAGCQPLLPQRLAYPEILPVDLHDRCLFASDDQLYERLGEAIEHGGLLDRAQMRYLQLSLAERFAGPSAVVRIDDALSSVAGSR